MSEMKLNELLLCCENIIHLSYVLWLVKRGMWVNLFTLTWFNLEVEPLRSEQAWLAI